jgi:hypothetical protein
MGISCLSVIIIVCQPCCSTPLSKPGVNADSELFPEIYLSYIIIILLLSTTCTKSILFKLPSPGYNESIDSEVVIEAGRAGPFSTTLQCRLEQSTEAISMLVQGHVQVHG